jgi:hypothetical protein
MKASQYDWRRAARRGRGERERRRHPAAGDPTTGAELMEAVRVLRLSSDLFIAFTTRAWDRVTLRPSWLGRCEDEGTG